MLKRLKTFIGLQSLQVEAFIRREVSTAEHLYLTLKWSASETRTLTGIHILLKEEYSRGRWTGKHRQTFQLGEFHRAGKWTVEPDLPFLLNADIPLANLSNQLDRWHRNPFLRPLSTGIRWLENVRSTYYLELTMTIQGAALPAVRKIELPDYQAG